MAGILHDTMNILEDIQPPAVWHSDPLFEDGAWGRSTVSGDAPSTGQGSLITGKHSEQLLWSTTAA